jgi:polyribonucleotide nucleotidyltransferase
MRIQDAELPKPYQQAKPARFIDLEDVIYLKFGENNAVRIKNKKDLLTLMSDDKDQINDFIGDNKLNINNIEDLKRIVLYYNGL